MSPPSAYADRTPRLGFWAVLALVLVAATAVYTDLLRFDAPLGEKYIPAFGPSQVDFSYPYISTRALLAGVNPYRNNKPEFTDPYFGVMRINGAEYKQLYPPGSLVTLVPLALWKGPRWEDAAGTWLRFSVVSLAALAAMTWWLVRRVTGVAITPLWIAVVFVCLVFNPGVELGLERGQSDVLTALLAWAAIVCFLRESYGFSMFLAIWSTAIKGYPVIFTAGLFFLALLRGQWRRTSMGVVAAGAIFVLPVWRLFADAAAGAKFRSSMFEAVWYNSGFRNLVFRFAPAWAEQGRWVLEGVALLVTAAAWVQAWRVSKRGTPAAQALWLTAFSVASLGAMIGYSGLSVAYNLILILPGLLVLAASQRWLRNALALPPWAELLLGVAFAVCGYLFFAGKLGVDTPASAYGLAVLFVILAIIEARGAVRPGERAKLPDAA